MKPIQLFSILLLFITNIQAQDKQNVEHTITSKAFEVDRKIRVFLPERYFTDSTGTFIVTYVLDAQDDQVWNMVKSNIDYMVSRYTVIPMIVVGIVSDNRGEEFNPQEQKLHAHFKEEVFPLIEHNYRVKPFRTIVGHSWGGAFVGNTLFGENTEMFDAYIGICPSLDAMDGVIFNQADSLLQNNNTFKKYFYFSSGDIGFEAEYRRDVLRMDSLLSQYPNETLAWKSHHYAKMDHFQAFIPAVNDGLTHMSRNYFADQMMFEKFAENSSESIVTQMEKFYTSQEKNFGFTFRPTAKYLRYVGDGFGRKNQYKHAIPVYKLVLEMDEENRGAWFNLANAYDQLGETGEAKSTFTKALTILEKQKTEVSESYYNNMSKWANEQLAKYE